MLPPPGNPGQFPQLEVVPLRISANSLQLKGNIHGCWRLGCGHFWWGVLTLLVSPPHLALDFQHDQVSWLTIFLGREKEGKAECIEFCFLSPYKSYSIPKHWDSPFTVHLFALNIGKWDSLVFSWVIKPNCHLSPCLLEMWLNLIESPFFDL